MKYGAIAEHCGKNSDNLEESRPALRYAVRIVDQQYAHAAKKCREAVVYL